MNKQLRKGNDKMMVPPRPNGLIANTTATTTTTTTLEEDVEFIQSAARLLDDFEKLNEHAYLPVIKILFDWMKSNPDVLKMSGKVLYQNVLCFLQGNKWKSKKS